MNQNSCSHFSSCLVCFSLHETEEDGPERLHSATRRKLLRLQAVSTSLTRLTATAVMERQTEKKKKKEMWECGWRCSCLISRGEKVKTLSDSWVDSHQSRPAGLQRRNSSCVFFLLSPEVQSILNLSPPQDAELMNANPSPPVSLLSRSLAAPSVDLRFVLLITSSPSSPPTCSRAPRSRLTWAPPPTPQPNPATFTSSRSSERAASARCCWLATGPMTSSTP